MTLILSKREIIRPSRRGFIAGAAAALCAPSIVRATSLSLTGVGKPSGGSPPPTIARVQGNLHQNGSSSLNSAVVTLTAPVGNGNMLCVAVYVSSITGLTVTVEDDKANIYTAVGARPSGTDYGWYSFYFLNATNGPQTISALFNGGTSPRQYGTIIVTEFSGVLSSGALDGHSENYDQSGTNTTNGITSGTATTTANGDLIWGACVNLNGASTLTKSSTFTQDQISGQDFNTEYLIQSTAGSIAATWTGTTTDVFSSIMMAFKHV